MKLTKSQSGSVRVCLGWRVRGVGMSKKEVTRLTPYSKYTVRWLSVFPLYFPHLNGEPTEESYKNHGRFQNWSFTRMTLHFAERTHSEVRRLASLHDRIAAHLPFTSRGVNGTTSSAGSCVRAHNASRMRHSPLSGAWQAVRGPRSSALIGIRSGALRAKAPRGRKERRLGPATSIVYA
jgi:hypothetical protein